MRNTRVIFLNAIKKCRRLRRDSNFFLVLRLKDEIKIKEVHQDGKLEMENSLAQIIATRMENED